MRFGLLLTFKKVTISGTRSGVNCMGMFGGVAVGFRRI
jgi:hypothetical protein